MSDRPGFSRRGLFTAGLSRVAAELDELQAVAHVPEPDATAPPTPAPSPSEDPQARAERIHRAWDRCEETGLWAQAASVLVASAPPQAAEHVLDAAAGDGNVALAVAGAGARVTACDIAPAMVARGARRAAGAGAAVDWLEADLAALPFADASFDRVLSAFGPMFCHDGRAAIDELFRVVRPGGTVAFTAWMARGVVGRLLRLAAALDPPPRGMAGPLAWGREERLRQDLEHHSDRVEFGMGQLSLHFDDAGEAAERLVRAFAPLAAIEPGEEVRAGVRAIVDELAGDRTGPLFLPAPYLVTVAQARQ